MTRNFRCLVRAIVFGSFFFLNTAQSEVSFSNPGGMWLPNQLGLDTHQKVLKDFNVDYAKNLTDPSAFPLGAMGQFHEFGCSATFISPKGLIVTNHHCVGVALGNLAQSNPGIHEKGYLAKDMASELPAGPGHGFWTTPTITEVTDRVLAGLSGKSNEERAATISKRSGEIVTDCEKGKESTKCEVLSLYEGAKYFLFEHFLLSDLRLVYAPPNSVGSFGGDIDNFRWPRHTGDFAIFRAYVGRDGKPAAYATNNVPFSPQHFVKVASEPLREGDFVLCAGYPGQTGRFQTSHEVEFLLNEELPRRKDLFTRLIRSYDELRKDPSLIPSTENFFGYYHNFLIVYDGSIVGLKDANAVQVKRDQEKELASFIARDAATRSKYGHVLPALEKNALAYNSGNRNLDTELVALLSYGLPRYGSYFNLGLGIASKKTNLLKAAYVIVRMAKEREKAEEVRSLDFKQSNWKAIEEDLVINFTTYFDPKVDSAEMDVVLQRAVALPAARQPVEALAALLGTDWADLKADEISERVQTLYKDTKLGDAQLRAQLLQANFDDLKAHSDPLIQIALKILPVYEEAEKRYVAYEATIQKLAPDYIAALMAASPTPLAADANSTLRITYGTVRGYTSENGNTLPAFTTLDQMVKKHTGQEPFNVPQEVLNAAKKNVGPYRDSVLGDLPINFVSDLDITNGSSGSSAINAKGELVGLVFDGNYESIPGRWVFNKVRGRAITADVRYLLWMLDAVHENGEWLLEELNVKPSLDR